MPEPGPYRRVSLNGVAAPSAPTALYSFAKKMNFGRFKEGRCADLAIHDRNRLLSQVRPGDLICVTALFSNYDNAIGFIRESKQRGAETALGGPWATVKTAQIAARQSHVLDYIVPGEGEAGLAQILEGKCEKGIVRASPIRIQELPGPDFSGWSRKDLLTYFRNYMALIQTGKYGAIPEDIPAFVFFHSARGCIQVPRCKFCGSRLGGKLHFRTGEQFFGDVGAIREQFASVATRIHVFDCSDSFSSSLSRFDGMEITTHPETTLTAYVRSDEVTVESARLLRRLGVTRASIGIETGSQESMDVIGKGFLVKRNLEAVRTLADCGINIYVNAIYGLLGETPENLRRTVDHIEKILDEARGRVYRIGARLMTPLPRAQWYHDLLARLASDPQSAGLAKEINESDGIDLKLVTSLWIRHMTNLTSEDIERAHSDVVASAKSAGASLSSEKPETI